MSKTNITKLKNFKFKVKDKTECILMMHALEKNGITWGIGTKPTEWASMFDPEMFTVSNGRMYYCMYKMSYEKNEATEISVEEYIQASELDTSSPCVGCVYYNTCGDIERTEPCKGARYKERTE